MPKIRKPPPYFLKHVVERFREGPISVGEFDALQDWAEFQSRAIAFTIGTVPHGTEVDWPEQPPAARARLVG
jgi:hypothetical protein